MSDPCDQLLIERVAGGDRQAFAALYDRYAPRLLGLIVRILGIQGDAEDVLQETFLQVWRTAERFDSGRAPADVWLLLLARSRALDRLRRRVPVAEAAIEQLSSDDPTAEVARQEDARLAREAVRRLPLEQRMVVELAFFHGLTHEEIAARLNTPLGTVKTRIRLGLNRLRACMAPSDGPAA